MTAFSVSPDVGDSGFDTIEHALQAVRELPRPWTDDVVIELEPTVHRLARPVELGPDDGGQDHGGQDGHKLTVRSRPGGGRAVLDGTHLVEDWQPAGRGRWQASVGDRRFGSLLVDGVRCTQVRWPAEDYARGLGYDPDAPRRRMRIPTGDLPPIADPGALRVFVWPGGESGEWNWFSEVVAVTELDRAGGMLTLAHDTRYPLGPGTRFFLLGAGEFLELPAAESRYFLDRGTGELLLHIDGDIAGREISAAAVPGLVVIRGRGDGTAVTDVRLENLVLRGCDRPHELTTHLDRSSAGQAAGEGSRPPSAAVHVSGAERVAVVGCEITATGLHGVHIEAANREVTVADCWLHDIGHTGVQVDAPRLTRRFASRGHRIVNNLIHHTGRCVGHGAGIQLSGAGECVVAHNRVHDTPRYAVSIKGPRPGTIVGSRIDGVTVTRQNAHEFIHSRDNVVEYNDLSHANTDSQDTGVFESWGPGLDNVVRNNRVRDSEIRFSFGFGIYLDDATNRMTVERNLVHGLQRSRAAARGELGLLRHPIYAKGIGNVFRDNVVADNGSAACFGCFEMAGEPCRNLTLERNVFAECGPAVYSFQNWSEDRFAAADHNLFFDPDGSYLVDGVPGVTDLDGWRSHPTGHDRSSLTADPRFMDARHGDFRLRHDSPAWALGIEPIDLAAIGLQPDHPFADPDDPIAAVMVAAEDGRPFVRLSVGETVRFHLTVRSERGFVLDSTSLEVFWSSRTPRVAAADISGEVTANAPGVARITATTCRGGAMRGGGVDLVVS